jgi:hypothetical protein
MGYWVFKNSQLLSKWVKILLMSASFCGPSDSAEFPGWSESLLTNVHLADPAKLSGSEQICPLVIREILKIWIVAYNDKVAFGMIILASKTPKAFTMINNFLTIAYRNSFATRLSQS